MSTLLLRLAAPLQAWGVSSKFDRRDTQRMPTKSGVVGLLAAALGRRRDETVEDLNALVMGVRADQEGELLRDYHVARSEKTTYVTKRYYLCDAVFLVGLEGEESLLERLDLALGHPMFPLFLGRRSCPPQGRVTLGVRRGLSLRDALLAEPWQASALYREQYRFKQRLQVMLEVLPGTPGAFFQRDVPLSFSQAWRQYAFRAVKLESQAPASDINQIINPGMEKTTHDAFADWEV